MQERINTAHVRGKSIQLAERQTLVEAAERRENGGELWMLLVLIRIFVTEHVGRFCPPGSGPLLELDNEAYEVYRKFFNELGDVVDELTKVAEGSGQVCGHTD